MIFKSISLIEMLNATSEEETQKILLTFSSCSKDIESFLHSKAIQYENTGISRTTLIFCQNEKKSFLAGYFSIANKSLNINKKNFEKLSKSKKKLLLGYGYRTNQNNYTTSSILLGQLGKNCTKGTPKISGDDILNEAYKAIKDAYRTIGGRFLWLECEDNDNLKNFYERNGFSLLENFQNNSDLLVYIKKLSQI